MRSRHTSGPRQISSANQRETTITEPTPKAGISETCAELGGALGIAFFGSIGVAIYRGMLAVFARATFRRVGVSPQ